jgi:hypothetical protein
MKFVNGKPVPLTDLEKVMMSVSQATTTQNPHPDCATWASDIRYHSVSKTPVDADPASVNRSGKSQRMGERVDAEGYCVIHRRRLSDSRILSPRLVKFQVVSESKFDEWGLPDFSVKSFKIESTNPLQLDNENNI